MTEPRNESALIADNDRRIREITLDWLRADDDEDTAPIRFHALKLIEQAEARACGFEPFDDEPRFDLDINDRGDIFIDCRRASEEEAGRIAATLLQEIRQGRFRGERR